MDRVVDGRAGRHHDPDDAWRFQLRDDLGEIVRRRRAQLLILRDDIGAPIVDDGLMSVAHEALDHVPAHPAEADHCHLHVVTPARWRSQRVYMMSEALRACSPPSHRADSRFLASLGMTIIHRILTRPTSAITDRRS